MSSDPTVSNPDVSRVIFENDRVRVLDEHRDVELSAGHVGWLPAQEHAAENIGDTETHVIFVELKAGAGDGKARATGAGPGGGPPLGPQ